MTSVFFGWILTRAVYKSANHIQLSPENSMKLDRGKKGAVHKILPPGVAVVQCMLSGTAARAGELCENNVKWVNDSLARGRPTCFPCSVFLLSDYLERLKRDSHLMTWICAQPSK